MALDDRYMAMLNSMMGKPLSEMFNFSGLTPASSAAHMRDVNPAGVPAITNGHAPSQSADQPAAGPATVRAPSAQLEGTSATAADPAIASLAALSKAINPLMRGLMRANLICLSFTAHRLREALEMRGRLGNALTPQDLLAEQTRLWTSFQRELQEFQAQLTAALGSTGLAQAAAGPFPEMMHTSTSAAGPAELSKHTALAAPDRAKQKAAAVAAALAAAKAFRAGAATVPKPASSKVPAKFTRDSSAVVFAASAAKATKSSAD